MVSSAGLVPVMSRGYINDLAAPQKSICLLAFYLIRGGGRADQLAVCGSVVGLGGGNGEERGG